MGFTVRLRNIAMLVVLDAGDICASVNTLAIVGSQYNVIRDPKLYMFIKIHFALPQSVLGHTFLDRNEGCDHLHENRAPSR